MHFFSVWQLFEQGLQQYTWRTEESADFIETATALVCVDLHRNLDIVQTNCATIAENTLSWSNGMLDVFTARDPDMSYSIEELISIQRDVTLFLHVMYIIPLCAVKPRSATMFWLHYIKKCGTVILKYSSLVCHSLVFIFIFRVKKIFFLCLAVN